MSPSTVWSREDVLVVVGWGRIGESAPCRIVNVSCNATLAPNAWQLVDPGYALRRVVRVDMFADAHVECVAPLERAQPTKPPPQTAAAAGRVLATLHGLALPAPRPAVRWLTYRRPEQAWRALVDRAHSDEAVWADALAAAVPGFLALDAVCDERDPNARAILSHASLAPDAVRVVGQDEVVVIGWEHACAIPADWELGAALQAWSQGSDLDLGVAAAQSLFDAYRELAEGPDQLTLSMFASGVTSLLNWTATQVEIALADDDEEQRELATRSLPSCWRTRSRFRRSSTSSPCCRGRVGASG